MISPSKGIRLTLSVPPTSTEGRIVLYKMKDSLDAAEQAWLQISEEWYHSHADAAEFFEEKCEMIDVVLSTFVEGISRCEESGEWPGEEYCGTRWVQWENDNGLETVAEDVAQSGKDAATAPSDLA